MSHTTVLRVPPLAGAALDRAIRDAYAALRSRIEAWQRRQQQLALARATRDALIRLDDRTLHDLGLHRSEIDSVSAAYLSGAGDRRR